MPFRYMLISCMVIEVGMYVFMFVFLGCSLVLKLCVYLMLRLKL